MPAGIEQRLDGDTGITVTYLNDPLLFYRDQSQRAVHAGDYVSFYVFDSSVSGRHQYMVELGAWSTVDRRRDGEGDTSQTPGSPAVLLLDGEPLELAPAETAGEWNSANVLPLAPPAPGTRTSVHRVSADTLRKLAGASRLELLLHRHAGEVRYRLRSGHPAQIAALLR